MSINIPEQQKYSTIDLRKKLLDTLHVGHAGTTKTTAEGRKFCWPIKDIEIEDEVKNGIACLASGKNSKYQTPKNESGKLKTLTEPGQEFQINFTVKLHNRKINGENQLLVAVDRFIKWPTVKYCETSETKEVLKQNFSLYGIPEKTESSEGGVFSSKECVEFFKSKIIAHREYILVRQAVERAI